MTTAPPPPPPDSFEAPWQLRTYVMASALIERQVLDATTLTDPGGGGLHSWVVAVEQALLEQGDISADELDAEVARQLAVAAARTVH
jgi:hypothetical protein